MSNNTNPNPHHVDSAPAPLDLDAFTGHTPGPWSVPEMDQKHDADRSILAYRRSGNPQWIGRAYGGGILTRADDEMKANAALIAAAPALLAELRAARAETERLRSLVKSLSTELAVAVAYCGHELSGPTDHRAAEDGEPHWVCNARAALSGQEGA